MKNNKAKVIYEDKLCVAYIPEDAAVVGHIHVEPKQQVASLEDCDEEVAVQLFYVASYAATAVYEGLGAQGTNIICNNGDGNLVISVLPRLETDGIQLKWEPKQQTDLDSTASKIHDKADMFAAHSKQDAQIMAPGPSESIDVSEDTMPKPEAKTLDIDEENYKIKHLYRIP